MCAYTMTPSGAGPVLLGDLYRDHMNSTNLDFSQFSPSHCPMCMYVAVGASAVGLVWLVWMYCVLYRTVSPVTLYSVDSTAGGIIRKRACYSLRPGLTPYPIPAVGKLLQ